MPSHPLDPSDSGSPLIVIGACLLVGFMAHVIGRRAHVPRVTLLLLLGILVGPSGLDLAPATVAQWSPLATQLALSIIGFELGERFLGRRIRSIGRVVLAVSIVVTIGTALAVFVGLIFAGMSVVLSLIRAGISPATAPASFEL